MELRHLHYFVVLAEELSFSRAARRLSIAQPSLSQQMRQLEADLDTPLIDRSVRPIVLTNAGRRLLESAANILSEAEKAAQEVQRAGRGEIGRLRIGYSYGGLYDLVLTLLRRLRTAWPNTSIGIFQLAEREQAPALLTRRVDLVIGRVTEPFAPEIVEMQLREEKLLAILPLVHPLASASSICLGDLADERFVMFPRHLEPVVFDSYIAACTAAGFNAQIDYEVVDAQTQALIIAAGFGVGLTGDHLALRFPELAYVPIEASPTITRIVALWAPNLLPEAVRPFLDDL